MPTTVQEIIEGHRRKAGRILKRLADECDQFEHQRNLTYQGREARQAAAAEVARAELDTVLATEAQDLTDRKQAIDSQLLGSRSPTDQHIVSVRDARDRARKLANPEVAARELNLAEDDADRVLLTEIARECRRRSGDPTVPAWGLLWQQWVGQQDGGQELLGELETLHAEQTDPAHRLYREQAYSVGSALPESLRSMTPGQVKALATGADLVKELPADRATAVGQRFAAMIGGTED